MVLHVKDEQELLAYGDRLRAAGIDYCEVVECPDDEKYPSQVMSIGCAPTEDRDKMRRVLSSLPLAK